MKRSSRYLKSASRPILLMFLALLSVTVAARQAQAQRPAAPGGNAPAGNAENGKKAYTRHSCFSCHGYSGDGGTGPRLAQNPIAFPAFRQYVRRPKRYMPPYGTLVTDQEMADIFAFLKTMPPSPDAKSIPLLKD